MPASHLQTLRAMAYNNAWANHRMLAACARLTQAEFEAPRTGFFPSKPQRRARRLKSFFDPASQLSFW
jgi:hypothetical protein